MRLLWKQATTCGFEAAEGKAVDWNLVFYDFQAAVDWPAAAYYSELLKTFPDAKVVFSYRHLKNGIRASPRQFLMWLQVFLLG